jgi:hypothetical protein
MGKFHVKHFDGGAGKPNRRLKSFAGEDHWIQHLFYLFVGKACARKCFEKGCQCDNTAKLTVSLLSRLDKTIYPLTE